MAARAGDPRRIAQLRDECSIARIIVYDRTHIRVLVLREVVVELVVGLRVRSVVLVEKLATAQKTVSSRLNSFQKCFQPKPKATNLKL